jgi:DNA-directed RNA polymerase subunit RPC12/RpoP
MSECANCGKELSLLQRFGSGLCRECQAEADRKEAEAERAEAEKQRQRRVDAAARGEASAEDTAQLAAEGYLVAHGRLIRCPICGHDRFSQRQALLVSRTAAFFNAEAWSGAADVRICDQCRHILWFAE